ncbi:hypothetical protein AB0F59_32245 [Micromonospora lupini]|uniref:hypothetical protein n=1 Tax=Micromonospora lupini TaxID=285679 RepID=UPI003400923F
MEESSRPLVLRMPADGHSLLYAVCASAPDLVQEVGRFGSDELDWLKGIESTPWAMDWKPYQLKDYDRALATVRALAKNIASRLEEAPYQSLLDGIIGRSVSPIGAVPILEGKRDDVRLVVKQWDWKDPRYGNDLPALVAQVLGLRIEVVEPGSAETPPIDPPSPTTERPAVRLLRIRPHHYDLFSSSVWRPQVTVIGSRDEPNVGGPRQPRSMRTRIQDRSTSRAAPSTPVLMLPMPARGHSPTDAHTSAPEHSEPVRPSPQPGALDEPAVAPVPPDFGPHIRDERAEMMGAFWAGDLLSEIPELDALLDGVREVLDERQVEVPPGDWHQLRESLYGNFSQLVTGAYTHTLGGIEVDFALDLTDPVPVAAAASGAEGEAVERPGDVPTVFQTTSGAFTIGSYSGRYSGPGNSLLRGSANFAVDGGVGLPALVGLKLTVTPSVTIDATKFSIGADQKTESGGVLDTRQEATLVSAKVRLSAKMRLPAARAEDTNPETEVTRAPVAPIVLAVTEQFAAATPDGLVRKKGAAPGVPRTFFSVPLTRTRDLIDKILAVFENAGRPLEVGQAARQEVVQGVTSLHRYLYDASNGRRDIWLEEAGVPLGRITFKVRVTQTSRRGEVCAKAHIERVRTSVQVADTGEDLQNEISGGFTFDYRPLDKWVISYGYGQSRSQTDASSVSLANLNVGVLRNTDHVGLHQVDMEVTAEVEVFRLGRARSLLLKSGQLGPKAQVGVRSIAMVAAPESEAFESGWQVDQGALSPEHDIVVRHVGGYEAPGRQLTAEVGSQAAPASSGGSLPEHADDRMLGMTALSFDPEAHAEILEKLIDELATQGYVPPRDLSSAPTADQVANLKRLRNMFSPEAFETYQAAAQQDGYPIYLRKMDYLGLNSSVVVRVRFTLKRESSRFVRKTREAALITLSMGIASHSQSLASQKKTWRSFHSANPLSPFGFKTFATGPKVERFETLSGKVSRATNAPMLTEWGGDVEQYEAEVDITATIERGGDAPDVVEGGGTGPWPAVRSVLRAAVSRAAPESVAPPQDRVQGAVSFGSSRRVTAYLMSGVARSEQGDGRTQEISRNALRRAAFTGVDMSGVAARVREVTGPLVGRGTAADEAITAFLSPAAIRANMGMVLQKGRYVLAMGFGTLLGERSVVVTVDATPLSITAGSFSEPKYVQGRIFTAGATGNYSYTSGTTWSGDVARLTAGGRAGDASAGAGAERGFNATTSMSRSAARETIDLQLAASAGSYWGDVVFTVRVTMGGTLSTKQAVELTFPPRQFSAIFPKPIALELFGEGELPVPVRDRTEALRDWEEGRLNLPAGVVAAVLSQWELEARSQGTSLIDLEAANRQRWTERLVALVADPANRLTVRPDIFGKFNEVFSPGGMRLPEAADRLTDRSLAGLVGGPTDLTVSDRPSLLNGFIPAGMSLFGPSRLLMFGQGHPHRFTLDDGRDILDVTVALINDTYPGLITDPTALWLAEDSDNAASHSLPEMMRDWLLGRGQVIGSSRGGLPMVGAMLTGDRELALLGHMLDEGGFSVFIHAKRTGVGTNMFELRFELAVGEPTIREAVPDTGVENYTHMTAETSRTERTSRGGSVAVNGSVTGGGHHEVPMTIKGRIGESRQTAWTAKATKHPAAYAYDGYSLLEAPARLRISIVQVDRVGAPFLLVEGANRIGHGLRGLPAPASVEVGARVEFGVANEFLSADPVPPSSFDVDTRPLQELPRRVKVLYAGIPRLIRTAERALLEVIDEQPAAEGSLRRPMAALAAQLEPTALQNLLLDALRPGGVPVTVDAHQPGDVSARAAVTMHAEMWDPQVIRVQEGARFGRVDKSESGHSSSRTADPLAWSASVTYTGKPPRRPDGGKRDAGFSAGPQFPYTFTEPHQSVGRSDVVRTERHPKGQHAGARGAKVVRAQVAVWLTWSVRKSSGLVRESVRLIEGGSPREAGEMIFTISADDFDRWLTTRGTAVPAEQPHAQADGPGSRAPQIAGADRERAEAASVEVDAQLVGNMGRDLDVLMARLTTFRAIRGRSENPEPVYLVSEPDGRMRAKWRIVMGWAANALAKAQEADRGGAGRGTEAMSSVKAEMDRLRTQADLFAMSMPRESDGEPWARLRDLVKNLDAAPGALPESPPLELLNERGLREFAKAYSKRHHVPVWLEFRRGGRDASIYEYRDGWSKGSTDRWPPTSGRGPQPPEDSSAWRISREQFGPLPYSVNRSPLDEDSLRRLVRDIADQLRQQGDARARPLDDCVVFVNSFARRLYPAGVRVGGVSDDLPIGRGVPAVGEAVRSGGITGIRDRLIAASGWGRLDDRRALRQLVGRLDDGTTVLFLESKADGAAGHPRAWHRTGHIVWGIDPELADPVYQVESAETDVRPGVVQTWAVVIDGRGRAVDTARQQADEQWSLPESARTAQAMLDAPTSHEFRRGGPPSVVQNLYQQAQDAAAAAFGPLPVFPGSAPAPPHEDSGVVSHIPAGGGPAAALSLARLAEAAGQAARAAKQADGAVTSLAQCVVALNQFARIWYPAGIKVSRASDDAAVGTGGAAGARAGVLAGDGWAPVASLTDVVTQLGANPGWTALIFLSFRNERQGHALAMYSLGAEGLYWVDPLRNGDERVFPVGDPLQDVPISAGLPAGILPAGVPAVDAWALVLDARGAVVEPNRDFTFAGTVPALLDPPVRHDFGALGVEVEVHNVTLRRSDAQPLNEKVVLVSTADRRFKLVVDTMHLWVGLDGNFYESAERMREAGVSGGPAAVRIPEVVPTPGEVRNEPGRPNNQHLEAEIRTKIVEPLWQAPPNYSYRALSSARLSDLYQGRGYVVNPEYADLLVTYFPELHEGAPLFAQMTLGVPLGGLLRVMDHLARHRQPSPENELTFKLSSRFGQHLGRLLAESLAGRRPTASTLKLLAEAVWPIAAVIEVGILTSVQLMSALEFQARRGLMKSGMSLVSRQPLSLLARQLPPEVADLLQDHRDEIRERFLSLFNERFEDFAAEYNERRGRPAETPVSVWDVEIRDEKTGEFIVSAGDLLDELLLPLPTGPRVRQSAFDVGSADVGDELDRRPGDGPNSPLPLVVVELRDYGLPTFDVDPYHLDFPDLRDRVATLTDVGATADAEAEARYRLFSAELGRPVALGLVRAAVLAGTPEGALEVDTLHRAIDAYLHRNPDARESLRELLEPFGLSDLQRRAAEPATAPALTNRQEEDGRRSDTKVDSVDPLTYEYGAIEPPKEIKPHEADASGRVRTNLAFYLLDEVPADVLRENRSVLWLYTVDGQGRVRIGTEQVADLLTPGEWARWFRAERGQREPGEAELEEFVEQMVGRGHPTIAVEFEPSGAVVPGQPWSRVSGEIRWLPAKNRWEINDQSGRYMKKRVPDENSAEAEEWQATVTRWVGNVAARLRSLLEGEEVAVGDFKYGKHPSAAPPELPAPTELDLKYGPLVQAKRVKEDEKQRRTREEIAAGEPERARVNPVWYDLADIPPKLVLERAAASWHFTVDAEGRIRIGSEELLGLLSEDEKEEVFRLYHPIDPDEHPSETEAKRRRFWRQINGQGHPTIAVEFAADGKVQPGRPQSRISGELTFTDGRWQVNDKSGRYMSAKVRVPAPTADEVRGWLDDVARQIGERLGVEVDVVLHKTGR